MRTLLSAALIAASTLPAAAFDRMTQSSCQNSFERIADLMDPDNHKRGLQIQFIRVTRDSWCQIDGRDPGFENVEFASLGWRTENTAYWTNDGIPPTALEVRIDGLDPDSMQGQGVSTDRPEVRFAATLRQDPNAGQLVLERAVMENDAGDSLALSGVFERVFLSSQSMMQVSMGSATFKAGLVTLTLDGTHENPFGLFANVEVRGVPQTQREAAFEIISMLPDGVVSNATRAELTAFAGDLPKPVGTLEIAVNSESGLGLMQVGMSAYNGFLAALDEGGDRDQLEILLHGLTVSADWSPRAQVAD